MHRSMRSFRRDALAALALVALVAAPGLLALTLVERPGRHAWASVADRGASAGERLAGAVVLASVLLLALLSTWLVACLLAEVLEQVPGRRVGRVPRARAGWRPEAVRSLVAVLVGSVLTVPSSAVAQQRPTLPAALDGLPVPDRLPDRSPDLWSSGVPERHRRPLPVATLRVRAGDTLWQLAADRMPASSDPADVDRAWRRLYARNRAVVGPDPDLLLPGTPLRVPRDL